jgi:hypothetical protein
MTVAHRRGHFAAWVVLGAIISFGFVIGLLSRPRLAVQTTDITTPASHGDNP